MKRASRTNLLCLLFAVACGAQRFASPGSTIQGFSANYYVHPTSSTRINQVSEYSRESGTVKIYHSTLGDNSTTLDSNTQIVSPSKKKYIDSILDQIDLSSCKSDYSGDAYSEDGSAADSDGDPLSFTFLTSDGNKVILIDTVDLSTLPEPLADLYNINVSLDFFGEEPTAG